jgi:hypothetical protein
MPSSFRLLGVAAVLLLAGACARPGRAPEEGWPETLHVSRLPPVVQGVAPGEKYQGLYQERRGERMYSREYRQKGFLGHPHSHSITVTWFPDRDEFYLTPNCLMNHEDSPLGPFRGDPRTVLSPPAP